MPRQSRIDAPGALHHVLIRGIERRKIFKDHVLAVKSVPVVLAGMCILLASSLAFCADYEYDVSGYGDKGYVHGEIEANRGSRDVGGYLYTEDGRQVHFEGEWTGRGQIEGYDAEGDHHELETE